MSVEKELKRIADVLQQQVNVLTVIGKDKLDLQEQINSLKQQVTQLEHDRDFYFERTLHD